MRLRLCLCFALLTMAACSAHRGGEPSRAQDVPAEYKGFEKVETVEPVAGLRIYRYRSRSSGLELLLSPKPGINAVAVVTAFKVGARFEWNGRTGLAHLFEHMMFRGTEHFPVPFETLASWGGQFNAYTTPDVTVYHELVPKERFDDALRFESERMRNLRLTKEVFDTERGAVVSERKMRTEDSPQGKLYWELYQLAYDVHPYKTGPIGWQKDLDATTYEDAIAFYNRFYAPGRAVLALVGDFTIPEALELVDKYYGAFQSPPFVAPQVPKEPPHRGLRRKVFPMKVETAFLADAVFGPTYDDPNAAVDSLIASLLGDDKLGYLEGELVEKGIASKVGADASTSIDPGLSEVFVVGSPGVPARRLEQAYEAARRRFPSWLTAERLENLKLYYLAGQWESLRDPMNLAQGTAHETAASGDPGWDIKFLAKVQKVTLDDIRARWPYWESSPRTRVILAPSAHSENAR